MNKSLMLRLRIELIWWLITAVIVMMVLYPLQGVFTSNPFRTSNIVFIVVAVTYSRYILFLDQTPAAENLWAKVALSIIALPPIFAFITYLQDFQVFMDQQGLLGFEKYYVESLTADQRLAAFNYFRQEYLMVGVTSVISAIILPIRMVISAWKQYNSQNRSRL